MIRRISSKDKNNFIYFYDVINKNTNGEKIFNGCLKHGNICFLSEQKGLINGILLINRKDNKKYLEIFSESLKISDGLLRILYWNINTEIYFEVKKGDRLGFIMKKYKFYPCEDKGSTLLLCKKYFKKA